MPALIEPRDWIDPDDALTRFRHWPRPVLFHSAAARPGLGDWSFLSADPAWAWELSDAEAPVGTHDQRTAGVFGEARRVLVDFGDAVLKSGGKLLGLTGPSDDSPPFQGGIAGLLTYEAGHVWERLPQIVSPARARCPLASLQLCDWVLAWNHAAHRMCVVVQPVDTLRRGVSSSERLKQIDRELSQPTRHSLHATPGPAGGTSPFDRLPQLRSNFTRDGYLRAVERIIASIRAGDIFQANLSQEFSHPANGSPIDLYRGLVAANPAPFAAYFDGGDFQVISASPERFLRLRGNEVETRPIKGTRGRRLAEADLFTRDELRESEKDRAENVMIVDLLRNDLSKVCRPGTIRVPQLCTVETYETVQHLVSVVRGELQPGRNFFDLLGATFPGGSITGAPKIRAMEIISELEQVPRGPYCGTMFYVGHGGQADSSILIRTFTQSAGTLRFPAGGGITLQSDPADEYAETLQKVEGLIRALEFLSV